MLDVTLDNLIDHLKQKGLDATLQEETQQVLTVLKEEEREYPTFFRIFKESSLLQIICFFPFQVPKDNIAEVARLLHLLNRELDIPGFGLDEKSFVCFFRVMLHIPGKQLDEKILESYLNTFSVVTKTFTKTIEAVAAGAVKMDQILEQAESSTTKIKP